LIFTDLRPEMMDDDRFLKLGVVADSGINYLVLGKVLPDRSLVFDNDVGTTWCEEMTGGLDDISGHKIRQIDNEDELKALYSFVELSGMTSRFSKMIAYIYGVYPTEQAQIQYTSTLAKEGLTTGLDRIRTVFQTDISHHRGLISRGMHDEGVRRMVQEEGRA